MPRDHEEQKKELLDPEDFCKSVISGFKKKASHNKNESMYCFWVAMGGALLVPLFVTLGTEFLWAKVIPSLLSVSAAFSTAWLQLRKPQQLWALYRTAQRELEDNLYKYQYKVDEYEKHQAPEKLLVEKVTKIAIDAHYSWLPMVPNPENIQAQLKATESSK